MVFIEYFPEMIIGAFEAFDEVEYLRVVVNQLRKKIEPEPSKPRFLLTEPWVGYRFAAPAE